MDIAWVFPGQGSQKIGMADQILSLPGAIERFNMASQIIGRDLLKICQGEESELNHPSSLNDTRNTQPALFIVESILIDNLKLQNKKPKVVAGHSLGELVALYAAEVINAETALHLLYRRSELMASAGGGAMTAVLGFERNQLEQLVNQTEGVVIANDNSESQVVLSGSPEGISEVSSKIKCKRIIPLAVSGAFHSPFMEEAADIFAKELDNIQFKHPTIPVISNSEPTLSSDGDTLKKRLKDQMKNGVRWRETMKEMTLIGINSILEIGPGNVLSGLAKRSMPGITTQQISKSDDF